MVKRRAKHKTTKVGRSVKPVTTTQIAYVDILDAEGNLLKRAELEPDERDNTGLMQVAYEETPLDEFHLIPVLLRQQQLERRIYKEALAIRGRKITPIHKPKTNL